MGLSRSVVYLLFTCAFGAPGFLLYQSTFALLDIPSLNQSNTNIQEDTSDEIALKMEFGNKEEGVLDMLIYTLKDQNFVVNNNSRICPAQNCEFEFKDTDLVYQPGSNRITMDGNMKVGIEDVTKISEISLDIQPVEASEEDGVKTEIVQGTFSVGMINNAEIEYNVNGT